MFTVRTIKYKARQTKCLGVGVGDKNYVIVDELEVYIDLWPQGW